MDARAWTLARWCASALLLSVVLLMGTLAPFAQAGLGVRPALAHAAARHGKNTFHPQPDLGAEVLDPQALARVRHTHIQQGTPQTTATALSAPRRALMPPADIALAPGLAAHFQSKDGRLTVDVPAGAVTSATASAGGGQAGASVTYDALGRTLTTTDALGATTTTSYAQAQPQGANVSDTAYYEQTTVVDTNGHKSAVLTDALGRETYAEAFTGNGGSVPYALYATTASVYDLLGDVVTVTGPNAGAAGLSTSAQMTATYDITGRQTGITDADLGTGWAYTYDQNGNVVQSVDPRGAAGTVYLGYDGLNRQLWRNTSNTPTGAYVSYSYDSTAGGNHGVGRLTGETFNTGASLGAGSYAYSYDARGQVTGTTTVLDGGTYPLGFGYNDAGMPTTTTYSDGEVATLGYTPEGWLTSLATTPSGGSATTLVGGLTYAGAAGAAMQPTAASVANGTYSFTASYDGDLRNTDEKLATGGGTTVYEQTHGYDAIGNVTSANTTLSAGTDNQSFCYDDEDRLVWASAATGVGPCGATNTAGTLAAVYAQSYQYDALDRMTTGPAGTFTYGPGMQAGSGAAPLHGVTALGSASYAYDAGGDRTNAGQTTNDVYDAERRLVRWTAGGITGKEAYDGEGQRVAHQTTSGATTTTTRYISGVEEVDAASGTVTKYYPAPNGLPQAVRVGTTLSYLARDGLGSVSAALDGGGNVTAARLYAPYGQVRYNTGTLPTAKGYTGQRADAASGLNYYGARYYDPATDPFADAIANGRSAEDRTRARGTRPASHGEYVPKGAEVSQRAVQTGCSAPTRAATRSSDSRAGRRASSSMSRQQRVRLERHFSCSSSEIGGVFFRQNT